MIEQIEECRNLMNNVEENGENCRPVNLIEREGYGWQESRRENGMNMVKHGESSYQDQIYAICVPRVAKSVCPRRLPWIY